MSWCRRGRKRLPTPSPGFASHGVVAVWANKRNFTTGNDVYSGLSEDGDWSFGPNTPVQDEFADLTEQWHPAVAGAGGGTLVVVWDDDRDGSSDIWLSWFEDGAWSEDMAAPGASGAGLQVHPAVDLDEAGGLHVA